MYDWTVEPDGDTLAEHVVPKPHSVTSDCVVASKTSTKNGVVPTSSDAVAVSVEVPPGCSALGLAARLTDSQLTVTGLDVACGAGGGDVLPESGVYAM